MIRSIFWWVGLGCIAAAAALAPLPATAAQDASWPTKPVTFIVPFPPGGSVDPLARLVGARLSAALGQQFIVDNRPGGSGSIGAAAAAKASPDGYTFLFVFDTHAVNPTLIPKLPFDTTKDLVPVTLVGTAPMAIVTHPSKPYKSFADVIKAAKAKPDTLTYGSIGSGSLGHLTMKLLEQAGGFVAVHVPYKGGGPMIVDATGGHIETGIASVSVLAPHVKGGKLRAVAVTGDKRSNAIPEVPALAEQGFPGFSALAWWGIFGTAGTPKPVLDKFHAELVKVFNLPEVRRQLADTLGMDLVVSSPEALQKFLLGEIVRWGKVVREHNIRGD
ncbi:MAG TPA: tripartite tricarboxylate transporter substrate binding protein [Candidatus Binatia bacterium]|jgi:tripartite-type tricarboxylate transporter receptor subunit TctC|nr:tripartite tricarboxylate transporter substrate binding protein [Candidatus Binatia bacterium]